MGVVKKLIESLIKHFDSNSFRELDFMPLIERKSKDMLAWENWQKHLNKKFGIVEEEPVEEKPEGQKQEEEIVSLEFLEKPVE